MSYFESGTVTKSELEAGGQQRDVKCRRQLRKVKVFGSEQRSGKRLHDSKEIQGSRKKSLSVLLRFLQPGREL